MSHTLLFHTEFLHTSRIVFVPHKSTAPSAHSKQISIGMYAIIFSINSNKSHVWNQTNPNHFVK